MFAAVTVSTTKADPTAIQQSVILGLTFHDIAALMSGKLRVQNLRELEVAAHDGSIILPDVDVVIMAGPDQATLLASIEATAKQLGIPSETHKLPAE